MKSSLCRWKSVIKLVQSVFCQSFFIKIAPKSITVETPIVNEVLMFLTSKKEWVLLRNCPSAFPIHSQQNNNYCVNSARSTTTHQSRRPVDAGKWSLSSASGYHLCLAKCKNQGKCSVPNWNTSFKGGILTRYRERISKPMAWKSARSCNHWELHK